MDMDSDNSTGYKIKVEVMNFTVDSDPIGERDNYNVVTDSSDYLDEPLSLPSSNLVKTDSLSTSNSLFKCFVCYKKLRVSTKGINESKRNSSTATRFAVSLEKHLYALSKMFDISPTIYQNETNLMGDVNVNIPFQAFCKSCKANIFSALDLLSEIESLKSKLYALRTEVKNCLIDTCNYEACENGNETKNNLYGNNKAHPFICRDTDTSISRVLTRLRKAYVQCWTPCKVNVNLKKMELPLSHVDPASAKGTEIQELNLCRDDVDVKINNSFENTADEESTPWSVNENNYESDSPDPLNTDIIVDPYINIHRSDPENVVVDIIGNDISEVRSMSMSTLIPNTKPNCDPDFDIALNSDYRKVSSEVQNDEVKICPSMSTKKNSTRACRKGGKHDNGVFRISAYRQRHLNEILTKAPHAAYVCNICGKGYRLKHYFEFHQKCHKEGGDTSINTSQLEEEIPHPDPDTFRLNSLEPGIYPGNILSPSDPSVDILDSGNPCDDFSEADHSFQVSSPKSERSVAVSVSSHEVDHDSDPDFDINSELLVSEHEGSSAKVKNKLKNSVRNTSSRTKGKKLNETKASKETDGEYEKGVFRISPYRQRQLKEVLETGSRAAYVCNICGKGYRLKHYFEVHQKCHSGNTDFPCSSCPESEPKIFTSLSKLRQHRLIRHRTSIFTSNDNDNKNIKYRQKESENAVCFYDSAGQLLSFQCKHCHGTFFKKDYLDSDSQFSIKCPTSGCEEAFAKFVKFSLHHQKSCCAAKPLFLKPMEIYQCEHCGINVSSSKCLSNHIISAHTKEFSYYCEVCGAGFVFESFLKNHMYCHTDEKEFKCQVCSSLFKRKKQLTIHMRNHTNEAPYMCQSCGRRFKSNNKLRNHEDTHSLEKNFPCHICGKMFVSARYVRNHVWATHEKARKFRSKPKKKSNAAVQLGDFGGTSPANSSLMVAGAGGLSTIIE